MNAPAAPDIENIAAYREILPTGFVDETTQRADLIRQNRDAAREAVESIHRDYDSISNEIIHLRTSIKDLGSSFRSLEKAYTDNNGIHNELVTNMRQFAKTLQETASLIRENLTLPKNRP